MRLNVDYHIIERVINVLNHLNKHEYDVVLHGTCWFCVCGNQSRIRSKRPRFGRRHLHSRNQHWKLDWVVCRLRWFWACWLDNTMVAIDASIHGGRKYRRKFGDGVCVKCLGVSRSPWWSVSECLGVCLGVTWSVTLVSMERCGASGATLDPDLAGTHMIANKSKTPSLERLGKIKLPPPDTSIYHNENKILH